MLKSIELALTYRETPTGLYLISSAHEGKRNVQFAFRSLGLSDDPPLLLIGIQEDNFSREMIQKSREFVVNVCSENQLHAVTAAGIFQDAPLTTSSSRWAGNAAGAVCASAAGCRLPRPCRMPSGWAFHVEGSFLFVGEALAAYRDDQVLPVGRLAGKTFRLNEQI